jgi:hypothetical protein
MPWWLSEDIKIHSLKVYLDQAIESLSPPKTWNCSEVRLSLGHPVEVEANPGWLHSSALALLVSETG